MKKYLLLLILSIIYSMSHLHGQIKVGTKVTGKHESTLNKAKLIRSEAIERKKVLKKFKQQAKALKKYNERYNKLKNEKLKEFQLDSSRIPTVSIGDSLSIPIWDKKDSLALSKEILFETNFPEQHMELILNPIEIDTLVLNEIDSAAHNSESFIEDQIKEFLPVDLIPKGQDPLTNLPNSSVSGGLNPKSIGQMKIKKPNPNFVKPEAAKDLFKKIDSEKFQKIQTNLKKLKKKYSSLPDTRFPEEGIKRNSLQDLPFKKRLYFGGNFNISSTDPFILDTNPQLGYWINKKWLGGIGLLVREQFNNDLASSLVGDAHGYSFFTRYDVIKNFFAWAEAERQVNKSIFYNRSETASTWQEALLLGVGRDFKIGPMQMMTMILYNINFKNNTLHRGKFVLKFGFRLSRQP